MKLQRRKRTVVVRPTASQEYLPSESSLLSLEAMRREMRRERMRSARSSAAFSVVPMHLKSEDICPLADVIQQRIRLTDTAGFLEKMQLGLLLPDTPEEGAWKLTDDLLALLPPGYPAPFCEVYLHPYRPWAPETAAGELAVPQSSDDRREPVSASAQAMEDFQPDRARQGAAAPGNLKWYAKSPNGASAGPRRPTGTMPMERLLAQRTPVWKRSLDVAGAGVGLCLLAPVMLAAAVAIKCSSKGPVLFRQQREGKGARRFTMYKFRTMVADADDIKRQLMHLNEQDGPAFKIENDPRVTRIGAALRKTSIDELPQLWNVLLGDMSLVGPRPLPVGESQACTDWQRQRLDVTPGMTCLWQVRDRRSKIPFAEWIRLDMKYIATRSMRGDLKLILQTIASDIFRMKRH